MASKPLVSVVIATYNMAGYLPLAIRSVLEQTYDRIEALIVDDGSTDDTRSVVEPFLSDSRIRYLGQENKGQGAAKNHGVREAKGEYVAFLDADDLWAHDKLELQLPVFLDSEGVGVVYSRYIQIDEAGREVGISQNEFFRGRVSGPLLVFNFIGFGTSVVKKECFDRLGYFKEDLGMGIDYDLWLRFSTQYEFDYVDRPLLYYRLWSGQMSNNCRRRYLNGIEVMKSFLREFPDAVDKDKVNEAWAHTYTGYGECLRNVDQQIGAAFRMYLRALFRKPAYLPVWKCMAKAILGVR
ncbi:MAG: glycosyltransferase [Gammaproteobacteria bacterium]|nr:glycosyltransferase [Gammaproteobacteria bacterium]